MVGKLLRELELFLLHKDKMKKPTGYHGFLIGLSIGIIAIVAALAVAGFDTPARAEAGTIDAPAIPLNRIRVIPPLLVDSPASVPMEFDPWR